MQLMLPADNALNPETPTVAAMSCTLAMAAEEASSSSVSVCD